ncbi:hypothetical protein [Flavobacterium alkalisoli]|uniref:hypothetical protein n=1 Tax=Flavobacterium alkalisoli TaxID=2602769 RepID=UPI003A931256
MKLRLLFFAAFLSLASCSSDDSTDPVNGNPVDKNLKEIARYNDGEDQISELRKFTDNKMTERYIYNEGEAYFSDLYTYNEQGLLISRTASIEDQTAVTEITYDELGKIIAIDVTSSFSGNPYSVDHSTVDYTEEGVIKVTMINVQGSDTTVSKYNYYLDAQGRVYKIASVNSNEELNYLCEAVYNGNNVVTYYSNMDSETGTYLNSSIYTYDNETVVKGDFLKVAYNQFGDNKANHVLFKQTGIVVISENYLIANEAVSFGQENSGTVTYEFDNDGFPVKQTAFVDGEADPVSEYLITYE